MAVTVWDRDAGPERSDAAGAPSLRMARRPMLLAALFVPLIAALWSFWSQQSPAAFAVAPVQPPTVAGIDRERGRILAADGTILAEGDVDARRYPERTLAANVVGFSGALQPDGRYGLEGVEHAMDARLAEGHDVRLTIDPVLQSAAERHLASSIEQAAAESGTVVMIEPGTGRILAAASHPTFDPNDQASFDRGAITNRAFLMQYEPGSVMKPFVVAALLQSGRIEASDVVDAEPTLRVGDKTFRDVAAHPDRLAIPDVLRYSSNTAMIHLSSRFAPDELYAWYRHFGFGRSIDLEAAYTRSGSMADPTSWVPQDQASVTIGQGLSTTPLQLAAAYSIFANDGVYVPPVLVEGEPARPPVRILSSEVARSVRDMLTYVVEESGLRASRIPSVAVAGKTGTADVYSPEQGTYPDGWYALTFAGMFPADAPRAVMVVMLHKPESTATSTYVAAPLFRAIGTEVVARWGTAPSPSASIARAADDARP